jgi:hypothetical protein
MVTSTDVERAAWLADVRSLVQDTFGEAMQAPFKTGVTRCR